MAKTNSVQIKSKGQRKNAKQKQIYYRIIENTLYEGSGAMELASIADWSQPLCAHCRIRENGKIR